MENLTQFNLAVILCITSLKSNNTFLTSQGNNNIGFPIYDKAINLIGRCPYVAPCNGIITFAGEFDWAAHCDGTGVIINNRIIVAAAGHGGVNGTGRGASTAMVRKGDTINTFLTGYWLNVNSLGSYSAGLRQLFFVPCE